MLWTLKSLCLVLILSSFAVLAYGSTSDQYPAYIWSQTIKGKKIEIKGEESKDKYHMPTNSSKVSEEIKNILDKTEANSFIIYHRPGMTTQNFVNTLINNYKIGNLLRESNPTALERSYTDVEGSSIQHQLKEYYENVKTVVIDSQDALTGLKKEFENAPKPFIHQYYVIELPYESDAVFDDVVYQVERAFSARTLGNHISVITGSKAVRRNLQEIDVEPTESKANTNADELDYFLTSNILTKILVFIPLGLLLTAALLQMYAIKTPTLYVEKGIDFGKIEK